LAYLNGVSARLSEIAAAHRLRSIRVRTQDALTDFSTNDYLGLAHEPAVLAALHAASQAGSSGSRLLSGSHAAHADLEVRLAAWLGRERALLFSSGYLAALGALPVLAAYTRVAYSDALNHACLIDGLRLARIERTVYPHLRLPLKAERTPGALIVTESVFGMDGDVANIADLLADLNDDDVLLVDEAHALGVAGPGGAGLAAGLRDERIVVLGTLSKSLGALGGFVAGPAPLVELLVNTARSFIFDTAIPPALANAASVALEFAERDERRRTTLHALVQRLILGLRARGIETTAVYPSPVVPIAAGSEAAALALAAKCLAAGFIAPAIRPPTVVPGASRLRLSVSAVHTEAEIDGLLNVLAG